MFDPEDQYSRDDIADVSGDRTKDEDDWEFGESEDDDADPAEPEEGDLVTDDHFRFWEYGMNRTKPAVVLMEDEDWRKVVGAHMKRQNFYPNIWFLSDHGNYHLISLEGE